MIQISLGRTRSLFAVVGFAFGASVLSARPAPGEPPYEVTDLGVLDPNQPAAVPTSVNSAGQVVGSSFVRAGLFVETRAFLYRNGQMQPLVPPSPAAWRRSQATGINASGQVAGWFIDEAMPLVTRAFVYSNGGFGEFGSSGSDVALGINDSGDFVGGSDWGPFGGKAVLHRSGVAIDVHSEIPGQPFKSAATGINAAGVVVGWSLQGGTTTAFRRDVGGTIYPLFGNSGWQTEAVAVNAAGQVAGTMSGVDHPDYGRARAVLWDANGTFRDLGVIGTSEHSAARAVNADGVVVGRAAVDTVCYPSLCYTVFHAFIHRGGVEDGMEDLNDQIPPGYELIEATAINDLGQIAATGRGPLGDQRAFLLTPVISPLDAISRLIDTVLGFDLPHGMTNSFVTKLEQARAALEAGDTTTACSELQAFINHAEAQSGKKLTVPQANQIITEAQAIRTALGCS